MSFSRFTWTLFGVRIFPQKGKDRLNMGASPQAPGIYRIVDQERECQDKGGGCSFRPPPLSRSFAGARVASQRCPILLQNCQ